MEPLWLAIYLKMDHEGVINNCGFWPAGIIQHQVFHILELSCEKKKKKTWTKIQEICTFSTFYTNPLQQVVTVQCEYLMVKARSAHS